MDIRVMRVKLYSKIAVWSLKFSQKLDHLSYLYIWKWYKAMEEDPRVSKELLNSVHNDPAFRKVFKRFENGQS
jgi:hypothetical protein